MKKKGWFIHVPRTGGTTIGEAIKAPKPASHCIRRYPQQHRMAWQVENELGACRGDEYFTFGFVRNPWDRALSFYYLQEQARMHGYETLEEQIEAFEPWLYKRGHQQLAGPYRGCWNMLTAPDKHHVKEHPMWLVDGVFRFEEYRDAWQEICNKHLGIDTIDLGHENASRNRPKVPYQSYYRNPRMVDLVEGWCWWEIRAFEYKFE